MPTKLLHACLSRVLFIIIKNAGHGRHIRIRGIKYPFRKQESIHALNGNSAFENE